MTHDVRCEETSLTGLAALTLTVLRCEGVARATLTQDLLNVLTGILKVTPFPQAGGQHLLYAPDQPVHLLAGGPILSDHHHIDPLTALRKAEVGGTECGALTKKKTSKVSISI